MTLSVAFVVVEVVSEAGPMLEKRGPLLTSPIIPTTSRETLMEGHSRPMYTADPHSGNSKELSLAFLQRRGRRGQQRGGPGGLDRTASLLPELAVVLSVPVAIAVSLLFALSELALVEQNEQIDQRQTE
jgi:hypothetical protein